MLFLARKFVATAAVLLCLVSICFAQNQQPQRKRVVTLSTRNGAQSMGNHNRLQRYMASGSGTIYVQPQEARGRLAYPDENQEEEAEEETEQTESSEEAKK